VKLPARGICAHRGGAAHVPENTCAAFREAARLGVHMIEFDVRRCADGEIAVLHDASIDRTTGARGALASLRFAEVCALDAGRHKGDAFVGERIPSLDEALAAIPRDVWINVQVKEREPIAAEVARRLADDGRLAQAFVAGDDAALAEARAAVPEVQVCPLSRQRTRAAYVEHALRLRAQFIQFHWLRGFPEPDLVARAREGGLRINYFCAPSDDVAALWRAGVDFPLVDDVLAALAAAHEVGIAPLVRGR
jgi:glycerophosphoryl diester phosphodiesterase